MNNPSAHQTRDPSATRTGSEPRCFDCAWDDLADCRRCAIRGRSLFSALRGVDFDQILEPIRRAVVPTGTILYSEGESANAVYTVRWGLVKLVKQSPDGTPRIVRLLGTGAAVGLEALKQGVYWHSAVAMRETALCRVPFGVLDRLQTGNAQMTDRLILQWERYMEYADRWITDLSTGPVKLRVQHLIALLLEITDSTTGEIEMPHVDDLAAILGTSAESVSRAMAELKRAKVLNRVAPRTYRCDLETLERLTGLRSPSADSARIA
jgi:CRP-like cAMP-binding protein